VIDESLPSQSPKADVNGDHSRWHRCSGVTRRCPCTTVVLGWLRDSGTEDVVAVEVEVVDIIGGGEPRSDRLLWRQGGRHALVNGSYKLL